MRLFFKYISKFNIFLNLCFIWFFWFKSQMFRKYQLIMGTLDTIWGFDFFFFLSSSNYLQGLISHDLYCFLYMLQITKIKIYLNTRIKLILSYNCHTGPLDSHINLWWIMWSVILSCLSLEIFWYYIMLENISSSFDITYQLLAIMP